MKTYKNLIKIGLSISLTAFVIGGYILISIYKETNFFGPPPMSRGYDITVILALIGLALFVLGFVPFLADKIKDRKILK